MTSRFLASARRPTGIVAFIPLLMFAPAAHASGLSVRLKQCLARAPHSQTTVGACVVDLTSGETVFAYGADESLIPASTMKIFAMGAAIEELGSQFEFQTVLATDGINLYVIGDGDPGFGDPSIASNHDESVYAVFEQWASRLRATGVGNIPGDLVIDESVFDDERLHPSWEPTDLGKWYAAPVGALNFNDNCVDLTLTPQAPGSPPRVDVTPAGTVIEVINNATSGGSGEPVLRHAFDSFSYKVSGSCPKRWPFGPVSFPDPGLLFADTLRSVFAQKGIAFSGSIARRRIRSADGTLPPMLASLTIRRTPIGDVLHRCGKDSQNLFAEALLKRAGYAWSLRTGQTVPVGSWANGTLAVQDMMKRVGTDLTGFQAVDGSGLSRDNRCTPRQQVSTLSWIHRQRWSTLFRESLSIAGVDGSLRRSLRAHPHRVFAKTGTMRGIRVLSGYVMGSVQPRFAFSVMFNNYKGPSTPYRAIQDAFCAELIREANGEP